MLRVTGLFIYPVKSLRGLAVTSADVDARGFAGDRRFLVVDRDNRFLTQRVLPRMALIETALADGELVLSSSRAGSIRVPLSQKAQESGPRAQGPGTKDPSSSKPQASESGFRTPEPRTPNPEPRTRVVTVWQDTVTAEDCGDEPAAWLSAFLGQPCRLVRAGDAYSRPIPARRIPPGLGLPPDQPSSLDPRPSTDHEVSFADGYPFLLIGEESLADLNARLAAPLPMNRFRPSLVVAGGAPYAEDAGTRFRIGDVVFHGATRCGRCVVTTTDQLTAERAPEPLRTLATYRRDADGDVMFGRNLIHETKSGRVAVGDAVELL